MIGYFEPHGRPDTIAKAEALEIVPRRVTAYKGAEFADMDTEAIVARHPEVCVVDEFPHTNIPGSERNKRWQDVSILLDHGIDVLTTMNIQHLESLNDQVWQISGIRVRETIPDWVLKQADEVVMIDLTPRALLNRLERGVVYSPEKAERAKANFFKEETLVALRELALRETAHEVNIRLQTGESSVRETRRTAWPVFILRWSSRTHPDPRDFRTGIGPPDPAWQASCRLPGRRLPCGLDSQTWTPSQSG